jgi:hypothetical protein
LTLNILVCHQLGPVDRQSGSNPEMPANGFSVCSSGPGGWGQVTGNRIFENFTSVTWHAGSVKGREPCRWQMGDH